MSVLLKANSREVGPGHRPTPFSCAQASTIAECDDDKRNNDTECDDPSAQVVAVQSQPSVDDSQLVSSFLSVNTVAAQLNPRHTAASAHAESESASVASAVLSKAKIASESKENWLNVQQSTEPSRRSTATAVITAELTSMHQSLAATWPAMYIDDLLPRSSLLPLESLRSYPTSQPKTHFARTTRNDENRRCGILFFVVEAFQRCAICLVWTMSY